MLDSASWHRTVLLFTFVLVTFILCELVTTILEPIYPPSTEQEKFFFGAVLLGSDIIGAIFDLFLAFELWFWTLAFGWSWWASSANLVETIVLGMDFCIRAYFTGPPEVARCLHLLVSSVIPNGLIM
jgi:hypothetical protein